MTSFFKLLFLIAKNFTLYAYLIQILMAVPEFLRFINFISQNAFLASYYHHLILHLLLRCHYSSEITLKIAFNYDSAITVHSSPLKSVSIFPSVSRAFRSYITWIAFAFHLRACVSPTYDAHVSSRSFLSSTQSKKGIQFLQTIFAMTENKGADKKQLTFLPDALRGKENQAPYRGGQISIIFDDTVCHRPFLPKPPWRVSSTSLSIWPNRNLNCELQHIYNASISNSMYYHSWQTRPWKSVLLVSSVNILSRRSPFSLFHSLLSTIQIITNALHRF